MKHKIGRHLPEVLLCGLIIIIVAYWVVNTARNGISQANRSLCLNNVHQLSAAVAMYRVDHDQYLPPGPAWHRLVWSYGDPEVSYGILVCPERPSETGFSYGLNYDIAGRNDEGVTRPVETALICDVRTSDAEVWWSNDIRFRSLPHNRQPLPCHRDRTVFAFGDGHVKALDPFSLQRQNWLP